MITCTLLLRFIILLVISPVGHIVNTVVLAAMEETADRHTLISLMAVRAAVALAAAVAAAAPWRGYGRAAHTAACVAEMVVLTLLCTLVQGRVAGFVCALALVPYRAVFYISSSSNYMGVAFISLGLLCAAVGAAGGWGSDEVPTWLNVSEAALSLFTAAVVLRATPSAQVNLVTAFEASDTATDDSKDLQTFMSITPSDVPLRVDLESNLPLVVPEHTSTPPQPVRARPTESPPVTTSVSIFPVILADAGNNNALPSLSSSCGNAALKASSRWQRVRRVVPMVPIFARDMMENSTRSAESRRRRSLPPGCDAPATDLQSFASALALNHIANNATSLRQLDAAVMFVDISGYSSVAHVLGDRGPHVFAGVVNSYLEIIVNKVREYGGDVVKFSGDALMVMWYSDQPRSNARAAASCAVGLLNSRCAAHPVEDTELTFGLHVGISAGTVISHIFAPRASTKDLTTPSHFHFLTGDPVPTVSIACGIAKRGEAAITVSAAELIGINDITTSPTADPAYLYLLGTGKQVRLPCPTKSAGSTLAKLVMPPPIISRVTAGINPFYLAEMRDLVVLFIHLGVDTDEQIWFD
eukprot:PhM_4_TR3048/c0_g1_i7/m.45231